METQQNKGKIFVGTTVSLEGKKTGVVEVEFFRKHPLYKKLIKRTHRFAVHYEGINLVVGDKVKIMETKPVSKRKHFVVVNKLSL